MFEKKYAQKTYYLFFRAVYFVATVGALLAIVYLSELGIFYG